MADEREDLDDFDDAIDDGEEFESDHLDDDEDLDEKDRRDRARGLPTRREIAERAKDMHFDHPDMKPRERKSRTRKAPTEWKVRDLWETKAKAEAARTGDFGLLPFTTTIVLFQWMWGELDTAISTANASKPPFVPAVDRGKIFRGFISALAPRREKTILTDFIRSAWTEEDMANRWSQVLNIGWTATRYILQKPTVYHETSILAILRTILEHKATERILTSSTSAAAVERRLGHVLWIGLAIEKEAKRHLAHVPDKEIRGAVLEIWKLGLKAYYEQAGQQLELGEDLDEAKAG